MSKEDKNKNSELRQDLVTGDWVVVSKIRSRRPDEFAKKEENSTPDNPSECLFCDPEKSGQEKDVLIYNTTDGNWSLKVFPNKFPAFSRPSGGQMKHKEEGPYFWMDSVGYHEVIVTKDHYNHIGKMEPLLVAEILDAYQSRYIDLMNKKSVNYIDIFHNHGASAGASIAHPHSQLIAIPVISPYVKGELDGAEEYHKQNKHCVYCAMVEWEREQKKRIVFENDDFLLFCPFASRANFEMWLIPKKHKPYFERITQEEKISAGMALHEAIKRLSEKLNNPDFNFYIHTSPCDGKDYPHFHWHIEILPKTNIWAGFEISTGVEIITISPEDAAEFLKNI
ncbi:MAG: galactose-1-phosphate uridylyltransferase [Candidatus Moranbacteria bacterium RIFOXYA12_FULL_35_19]|nr:MAG: Galactose-1-phosphate uridylyltransferase GalT [Candidatus Moranbacteria bacterium GW2011_GWF2_35_39]OGI32200.1 MAG: galactose-1-phosphate uridylyltransferase [Candidatus Moranbacteria bacterium RIFOXYB12_FULL_35_8]OGI32830.1 MAG: galactose-1-phosphate uridylyltransferase [Candidatus Moranbacteria bacterium RIFOXYC12_FULL_36_13]OGI36158.1 MAG: galactose-1-phosphate uridylyltransferase [Candidatus Moranbacteria bacterium RIFOXYA12_FULL_35_19]